MLKRSFIINALILTLVAATFAQNANTITPPTQPASRRPASSTRKQTTTTTTTTATVPAPPAPVQTGTTTTTTETTNTTRTRRATTPARASAAERDVHATFDALLRAIEKTDVEAVMNFYWNSPQLLIYNNNGTVTRGWTQVHANLASLYPDLKDVKLIARDVKVQMLGTDTALLSCLWTQTQEFQGTPESNSGRMTLLFRRTGGAWKIAHRHTSPDAPDPSRLPTSEQTAPPPVAPTPKPPGLS